MLVLESKESHLSDTNVLVTMVSHLDAVGVVLVHLHPTVLALLIDLITLVHHVEVMKPHPQQDMPNIIVLDGVGVHELVIILRVLVVVLVLHITQ